MSEAPKRACRFELDLQADTRDELASALFNLATRIERGELSTGVSGGYSSGCVYSLTESDRPTHAEYVEQLNAYLKREPA